MANTYQADAQNPRDFDCCAYRSKSGKSGCGALRYYHSDPRINKKHAFVEPTRTLTEKEIVTALRGLMETIADQSNRATLVQDRSVHIIKQVCARISAMAQKAVTLIDNPSVTGADEPKF